MPSNIIILPFIQRQYLEVCVVLGKILNHLTVLKKFFFFKYFKQKSYQPIFLVSLLTTLFISKAFISLASSCVVFEKYFLIFIENSIFQFSMRKECVVMLMYVCMCVNGQIKRKQIFFDRIFVKKFDLIKLSMSSF